MFLEGETVILNEYAKNGLPYRVGERCVIEESLYNSPNYDYRVVFDDGEFAKVKESELNKLTEKDKEILDYIFNGSLVLHIASNEEVKVLKVDYLHEQVEILHKDLSLQVVCYEALKQIGIENNSVNRKSWDQYFMDIASMVSTRATCDRLHVGCVIVKDKKIVSTGYNGSVSGQSHCDEVGHLYNEQGRCVRTIHAEQNSIIVANREDLQDATAYVTHQPCENCAKLLVQSGVNRIVYKEKYENKFSDFFINMVENICLKEE
jgi:dCMP deaminase